MDAKVVRRAGIAVCGIWVVWALHPLLAKRMLIPWDGAAVGQWGDAFGALNALFSALAFIAVLFTLKQQRDDLAKQQEQISNAEKTQQIQRFEQTFYELLRLLREARNDVEFSHTGEYLTNTPTPVSQRIDRSKRANGTEAFKRANFEMRYWLGITQHAEKNVTEEMAVAIYLKHIHSRYESTLGPYYRLLYTLLLRIKDEDVLTPSQRHRYGNLLRSQLTSHEVALCCYNGLAALSGSFKTLIVDFRLAKYLPDEFGRKRIMLYYPSETFDGRD